MTAEAGLGAEEAARASVPRRPCNRAAFRRHQRLRTRSTSSPRRAVRGSPGSTAAAAWDSSKRLWRLMSKAGEKITERRGCQAGADRRTDAAASGCRGRRGSRRRRGLGEMGEPLHRACTDPASPAISEATGTPTAAAGCAANADAATDRSVGSLDDDQRANIVLARRAPAAAPDAVGARCKLAGRGVCGVPFSACYGSWSIMGLISSALMATTRCR